MRGVIFALLAAIAGLFLLSLLLPLQSLPLLLDKERDLALDVLVELRLPRALLAIGYGALLGASGAAIQGLFANPLASPDITGASAGAALGAVLAAYIFGLTSPILLSLAAIAGALAALAALLALAGPSA